MADQMTSGAGQPSTDPTGANATVGDAGASQAGAQSATPASSGGGLDFSYPEPSTTSDGQVGLTEKELNAASEKQRPGDSAATLPNSPAAQSTSQMVQEDDEDNIEGLPPKSERTGGSLADVAKKLSTWKDDVMSEPQAPAGTQTNVNNPLAPDLGGGGPSDMSSDVSDTAASNMPPAPPMSTPASSPTSVAGSVSNDQAVADTQNQAVSQPPAQPMQTNPEIVTGQPPVSQGGQAVEQMASSLPDVSQSGVASNTQNIAPTPAGAPPVAEGSAGGVLDSPVQPEPVSEQGVVSISGSNTTGGYPYTIDDLMEIVFEKDASDLHVTVDYPAMIRVDGDLMPVGNELVTEEAIKDLVLPVLPENKQELLEVNREVDLAYTFREDARFRINAFYTKGNISAAFRLIPNKIRTIEELKLPGSYHQLTKLPQGLVLVTGPTGHGKSTTLAAMLQEINETYPKHIITIEDPIEYVYPRARALVDQREMHEDTHSWEIALRSAMREDPDVVLVGEMRDFETIQAAITLAETGHLVFATLHTNSSAQTIDRVIDVFPEHQQEQVQTQLSMILEAIISQRLLPVKSGGRRAVSEVLLATGAVRNLIREGKSHQLDNVIRTSLDVGMKTLEHSLVDLIREGEITLDEAETVAVHPEEVSRLMKA